MGDVDLGNAGDGGGRGGSAEPAINVGLGLPGDSFGSDKTKCAEYGVDGLGINRYRTQDHGEEAPHSVETSVGVVSRVNRDTVDAHEGVEIKAVRVPAEERKTRGG